MVYILLLGTGCISFLLCRFYYLHHDELPIYSYYSHLERLQKYSSVISLIYHNKPSTMIPFNNNQDHFFWEFQPRESHFFFKSIKKNNYDPTRTMIDGNNNDNSMTIEIIDNPFFKQAESIKKEKTFATGVITTRDEISKKTLIDDIYHQINQSVWDNSPVHQFYKHLSTISNLKMNPSRRRGKENKAEMPTIHIIADPTEIALLNENKLKKKKVDAKMLYISSAVIQGFNQVDFKIAERTTRTLQKLTYDIKIRNNVPLSTSTCSLHGFHRIKLCSFGYDLSRASQKLKYRMVASLKMPTCSFNYVKVYINNHPIGIFELFGSQDAPYIDNKLSYDEKRQLHQQKDSVHKYQIEPSVAPILKKEDGVCIINARYNNTIGNRESHNLQQNSYKIMNESIWRKSDIQLNQHSISDGLTTGWWHQLPERNYLGMNNVLFKNIATNGVNTMDKVVDDHLLKENKPSSTMSSKAEYDIKYSKPRNQSYEINQ